MTTNSNTRSFTRQEILSLLVLMLIVFCASGLHAQDCATGYCPTAVVVHHKAGTLSPVTANITYPVVETTLADASKTTVSCWIAQNLGATVQASGATDMRDVAAGWYWQFNRKQAYAINSNGTMATTSDDVRTPASQWITAIREDSDWQTKNDPCHLLLGGTWRIPTRADWENVISNGGWSGLSGPFASVLKLHAGGDLKAETAAMENRPSNGLYSSANQFDATTAYYFGFSSSSAIVTAYDKAEAFTLRCLRDL